MDYIFTTERLLVRRFEPEDWEELYEYVSDQQVLKFEPYAAFNMKQAKEEAARRKTDERFYAVCLKDNNKLIGNLYFNKEAFDTWELGYTFSRKHQGNGYATESAQGMMNYAFNKLGARRIIALCNPKNTRSWKLMERLHMRREALFIQKGYFKVDNDGNPIWTDSYEYAILKSEWMEINQNDKQNGN
jgi:RimJ/RimL family protein N-acetyltransferase